MNKLSLLLMLIVILSACTPRSVQNPSFYDISNDSVVLTNGLDNQLNMKTLSFQDSYDDVYSQAFLTARSITRQQNLEGLNWYLASENAQTGDIVLTQGTNVCMLSRSNDCLPFQRAVKISVRESQDSTRNVFIQSSNWRTQSKEVELINYYIDTLSESLN